MVTTAKDQSVKDGKLKEYELVYILTPELADEALEARINSISQAITSRGGSIVSVDKWGKKKLAYPIKRHLEGHYVLTRFKLGPARCRELEANLRISEEVLRYLLIKIES
ncbi:MAG: 30S ribosomal protein S6 [Dehalococcoidales bacterium]|nr:30S ribosomal protein S6 [Dehalococcoidales bacterium]